MVEGKSEKPIRARFAPSPTGPLHIGGARTALFNWLFARQHGGAFILRIDDTDTERSKKEYENEIVEGLKWLGLDWDEFYRQSERVEIYKKYLQKLLEEEKVYYCYCSREKLSSEAETMRAQGLPSKYGGHCRNLRNPPPGERPRVIRFKTPEATVEFKDLIRGKISFDASIFGDMIIAKDLETPLYNFAAVIDDYEMKINYIIRGEEHLSNTPKQILFQKALGFPEPVYAHLPLILNPDRSKMSKRFADTALLSYKDNGYLAEAIVNFLALLGWHPKDEREIFSLEDLKREFDLKRVQKAGAVFNQDKLNWLNAYHIRNLSAEEIFRLLEPELKSKNINGSKDFILKIIEEEKPRIKKISDFPETAGFFFHLPEYEPRLLIWKNKSQNETKEILLKLSETLQKVPENDFNRNSLMIYLSPLIENGGGDRGGVLWPLRAALSGQQFSSDPLAIMEILGKKETVLRIDSAADKIKNIL